MAHAMSNEPPAPLHVSRRQCLSVRTLAPTCPTYVVGAEQAGIEDGNWPAQVLLTGGHLLPDCLLTDAEAKYNLRGEFCGYVYSNAAVTLYVID